MARPIPIRFDSKRGCGWRKPGGLYLVCDGLAAPCGRLPIPLCSCPTCSAGIKPSRGWTWLDADAFLEGHPCAPPEGHSCNVHCPLSLPFGRVGLLWVGETFYQTPADFVEEADRLGVSRRIAKVPKGFIVNRTWVWLAHRRGINELCARCFGKAGNGSCRECRGVGVVYTPAVFRAFKPTAIEYVTTGDETEEELQQLRDRDITPVIVHRDQVSQETLSFDPSEN